MQPRSWAPDGHALAGNLTFYPSPTSVTLLYDFAKRAYQPLPEGGGWPAWMSDSRRLLVARHDRIVLVDSSSGQAMPVIDTAAHCISLSRDDRFFSYIETRSESDVWMATFER